MRVCELPTKRAAVADHQLRRTIALLLAWVGFSITCPGCSRTSPAVSESPHVCVEFEFRVTDARTGQPIAGASIQRSDTKASTGPDGRYAIASECFTESGSIVYPDWSFTVSAPGYQSLGPAQLIAYTGARGQESYKLVAIHLTPDPAPR
jgi:hypothetical protein